MPLRLSELLLKSYFKLSKISKSFIPFKNDSGSAIHFKMTESLEEQFKNAKDFKNYPILFKNFQMSLKAILKVPGPLNCHIKIVIRRDDNSKKCQKSNKLFNFFLKLLKVSTSKFKICEKPLKFFKSLLKLPVAFKPF